MGRLFARDVLGIAEPTVGLLSIGEEDVKGSEEVLAAHALLRRTPGFAGNVEGRDILGGAVDVVVTDGFTGNVVLKTMEGTAGFLLGEVRAAVELDAPRPRRRAAGASGTAPHARADRPRELRRRGAAGRARAGRDRPRQLHRPRRGERHARWRRAGRASGWSAKFAEALALEGAERSPAA